MSSLSFDISGVTAALKKIENLGPQAEKIVNAEISAFALETVNDAKTNVPVDLGYLRNSIQYQTGQLEAFINVNAFYAAYVEFGTGKYVFFGEPYIDAELEAYASTFFVNGKGTMYPRPYLFPAYEKNRLLLIERLKQYEK